MNVKPILWIAFSNPQNYKGQGQQQKVTIFEKFKLFSLLFVLKITIFILQKKIASLLVS
jgi:hypothetical protein